MSNTNTPIQEQVEEIWKEIPGFEHYQISNLGRVRKISYLSIATSKSIGYPAIGLHKGDNHGKRKPQSIRKKAFVHRLIANAFIPNPHGLKMINHKDGNKLNYAIENLEWCTASHNVKHAYDLGLNKGGKSNQNRSLIQVDGSGNVKLWRGYRDIVKAGHTWNKAYDSIRRGVLYKKCRWFYLGFSYDFKDECFFKGKGKDKILIPAKEAMKLAKQQYLNYINSQQ